MTSCRSLILRDNPLTHARPGNRTIEALELDGYLYIPGFLNTHEVAELRAAAECIEPVAENLDADMTEERDGYLNKCINNAFNRDPLFVKYHANGGAAAPSHPELEWNGVGEQSPLCNAGDCLLFRCELWHCGAANRSDRVRHTFMIRYAHRMITQKFPPYLKFQFDPEIVARATPRQRRLLGEHAQSNYD